jgi:hypothetical protein
VTNLWENAAKRGIFHGVSIGLGARNRALLLGIASVVMAAVMLVPFLHRLEREEFHGDETHWMTSSQVAFALVAAGDVANAKWREQFYLYTQPQVGKMAIGASLAVADVHGSGDVIEYEWLLDPELNRERGAIPSNADLWSGRLPGAIAGWLGALMMWWLGSWLGRADVGLASALLLAFHPLWLANARRTGMDSMALLFGLGATLAAIKLARSRHPIWWLALGSMVGLAAATKYTGLLGATGAALPLLRLATGVRTRAALVEVVVGGTMAAVVAGSIVIGSNPALHADPVRGLDRSVQFFRDQASAMRASFPLFDSPVLVGMEIIDRVIWPIGFPKIIDTTLERRVDDTDRHVTPGQYGTPVVGLGMATAAMGAALSRRRGEAHPLNGVGAVGFTWFVVCYLALVQSLPIWWERWHLGLVPATCLLAAVGLTWAGRSATMAAVAAQMVATIAIGPSYLNHGFWHLLASPQGLGLHVIAVGSIIAVAAKGFGIPERLRARARFRAVTRASFGQRSSWSWR